MNKGLINTTIIIFSVNTVILVASACTFLLILADLGRWYSFAMYISLLSCIASAFFAFMSVHSLTKLVENTIGRELRADNYILYAFSTSVISAVGIAFILLDFEYGNRTLMRAPFPEFIGVSAAHIVFNFICCVLFVHEIARET